MARNSELVEGCAYYHCVFTLPFELNDLILQNQKLLYNLMFSCASDTLLALCRDKRHLGATPGIVLVLHTWGQQLNFHPHLHCCLSGGGLTKAGQFVESAHKGFLLPVRAVGRLFRGKFITPPAQHIEQFVVENIVFTVRGTACRIRCRPRRKRFRLCRKTVLRTIPRGSSK